jgi:hypothetical protein
MTEILTEPSTALWQDLVREGEQRAGNPLGEDLESYLVFTLMRHLGDAPLTHRVMALELLEALNAAGKQRAEDLRDVGDRCLLIAGLYPDLAKRRRVPLSYFVGLGQVAYDQLANELRAALASLYAELARAFAQLVRVLIEVRRLSGEWRGLLSMDRFELASAAGPDALMHEYAGAVLVPVSNRPN